MASNGNLKRSLSNSNLPAAVKLHDKINEEQLFLRDPSPSMIFPEQYDDSTLNLCVDDSLLKELEDGRIINWCMSSRLLMPLEVEEDGSSLVHSLSLYIFGVHDRRNVLRRLLFKRLSNQKEGDDLRTRWVTSLLGDPEKSRLSWEQMVEMASDKILDDDYTIQRYANLTGIHVFALANIIGRPIIVLSNSSPHSKDSSCGGIYLPLLQSIQMCEKSPVILGYKNDHFAPLISSENLKIPLSESTPSEEAKHCVPLLNSKGFPLPLKFLSKSENMAPIDELLAKYVEIIHIPCDDGGKHSYISAAMLKFKAPPEYSIELMWCLRKITEISPSKNNVSLHSYEKSVPCSRKDIGCNNFASSNSEKLCEACCGAYVEKKITLQKKSSVTNDDAESMNTSVLQTIMTKFYDKIRSFYAFFKPVENKLNDKARFHVPNEYTRHYNDSNFFTDDEFYIPPAGHVLQAGMGTTVAADTEYCSIHYDDTKVPPTGNDFRARMGTAIAENYSTRYYNTDVPPAGNDFQTRMGTATAENCSTRYYKTNVLPAGNELRVGMGLVSADDTEYCSIHYDDTNVPPAGNDFRTRMGIATAENCSTGYDNTNVLPAGNDCLTRMGPATSENCSTRYYNTNFPLAGNDFWMRLRTATAENRSTRYNTNVLPAGNESRVGMGTLAAAAADNDYYSIHYNDANGPPAGNDLRTTRGTAAAAAQFCSPRSHNTSVLPAGNDSQTDRNLLYQVGFKGASATPTAVTDSNHSFNSHQCVRSNLQNISLTTPDEYSLVNRVNRGLNQNHHYSDQHGLVNMQEENVGANKNKCLFCDNHSNPKLGGYCNECHSQKVNQINSTAKESLLLDEQQYGSTANVSLLPDEQQKGCKRVGCEFFGTIEYGGYCSGCFLDSTKQLF